jgi:hypothetical protein
VSSSCKYGCDKRTATLALMGQCIWCHLDDVGDLLIESIFQNIQNIQKWPFCTHSTFSLITSKHSLGFVCQKSSPLGTESLHSECSLIFEISRMPHLLPMAGWQVNPNKPTNNV